VFFVNTIDPADYGLRPSRKALPPGSPAPPACLLHRDNRCSIYDHPRKPVFCSDWKCLLLERLEDGAVAFESALRTVAEINQLHEKVALILPAESSRPVLKVALEAWENKKIVMSSGRLTGPQLLVISSFLRLVDDYLKPYKPGLFRKGS
jgi:hypothetical protein